MYIYIYVYIYIEREREMNLHICEPANNRNTTLHVSPHWSHSCHLSQFGEHRLCWTREHSSLVQRTHGPGPPWAHTAHVALRCQPSCTHVRCSSHRDLNNPSGNTALSSFPITSCPSWSIPASRRSPGLALFFLHTTNRCARPPGMTIGHCAPLHLLIHCPLSLRGSILFVMTAVGFSG